MDNEMLIIIARTGYRPHLTRQLLVLSVSVYAVLMAAVLAQLAARAYRQRWAPDGVIERGD